MQIAFLLPSPPPPGGGSAFNAGLLPALRALGHQVATADTLDEAAGLPVVDGIMLPALAPQLDQLVARDAVVIVHHVSASAGRDQAAREAVADTERHMLQRLRRVVATSGPVAERLTAQFGVAHPLLLHPGQPVRPRSPGTGPGCAVLQVGVLTPRKGHDRLLAALARLRDLDWTLTIAGDARRDPAHAASLPPLIDRLALSDRVTLLPDPDPDRLDAAWGPAALFATATAWEGYPAALAEALRRGLPVVAPRLPGIETLVPAAAGVLFPPDDPATFGKCLRRAIFDDALRTELADAAWKAGCALPDWPHQAQAFLDILKG